MPGLGPNCCCTPEPPFCCNLKSVIRWDIYPALSDPEPSGCCALLPGSYFPSSSTDCEFRRVVDFGAPNPCVDYCNRVSFIGTDYFISLRKLEIKTVLQNGTNLIANQKVFSEIIVTYTIHTSTGYTCSPGITISKKYDFATPLCGNLKVPFLPNNPFTGPQGFITACNTSSEPVYVLEAILA